MGPIFELTRSVVDIVAELLDLDGGVNRLALSVVSILVQDQADGAKVGLYNSSCGDDRKARDCVVVDAADIRVTLGSLDNSYITAGKATIGSTIDQGCGGVAFSDGF